MGTKQSNIQQSKTNSINVSKNSQLKIWQKQALQKLHQAIYVYEQYFPDDHSFHQFLKYQEVQQLKQILSNDEGIQHLSSYKPSPCAPYLSSIFKTIWKLILIIPIRNNLPKIGYNDLTKNKIPQLRKIDEIAIEKDVERTFTQSQQHKKSILARLLKILYGNVFQPLGYYSGESLVLGFILQCGFEQIQAYYIYIALKINRKYQFVRKRFYTQIPQQTISYKIAESFSKNLQTKYPQVFSIFDKFTINLPLINIADIMCLFCNTANYQIVAIIWNFMICQAGQIHILGPILTQIANQWYLERVLDQNHNLKDSIVLNKLLQSWIAYTKNIKSSTIKKSLDQLYNQNYKISQKYDDFSLISPTYKSIYEIPQYYSQYLQSIYNQMKSSQQLISIKQQQLQQMKIND